MPVTNQDQHTGIRDQHATLPIILAISANNLYLVKSLLASDNFEVNEQDFFGDSALLVAVRNNNPVMVKILLEAGADINLANKFSETPKIIAATEGFSEIYTILNASYNRDDNKKKPKLGFHCR